MAETVIKTTIAVMQPYFVPYAGYFRLFVAADPVVLYDCAQFPRRSYVHRNRLPDANGAPRWLTLPFKKAPREVRIADLAFAGDAKERLQRQARRFPVLRPLLDEPDNPWGRLLFDLSGSPVDYIARWLKAACDAMGLPFITRRSSELALSPELRGQERVLAIARHFGATRYLNAPGGRALYNPARFEDEGITLEFLREYEGPMWSILYRLLTEDPREIGGSLKFDP